MKRKTITLSIILFVSLTTLACIGFGGRGDETPNPAEQGMTILENWAEQTQESMGSMNNAQPVDPLPPEPEQAKSTTENVVSSDAESDLSGANEYSLTAQNFNCTCSVDGNNQVVEFKFNGDQLEYAGNVYDKIAENTYKYSSMGYYILESGEGENKTSTQVDEEQHVVIIITKEGFNLEHYKGDESSPCCYYTFTKEN